MINLAIAQPRGSDKTAASSVQLSSTTFGREFNEPLIHQVVVAQMAANRAGTKAQKTRAQVSGGGKKPWNQKGTGRARAGTSRSPLWRKGGMIFAATPRNFEQKVNKKMYRGAVQSLLSELVRQNRLVAVDEFNVETPKTRELVVKLNALGFKTALIVVAGALEENLYLAARNLPNVEVIEASCINPLKMLKHDTVIMTVAALKECEEVFA